MDIRVLVVKIVSYNMAYYVQSVVQLLTGELPQSPHSTAACHQREAVDRNKDA